MARVEINAYQFGPNWWAAETKNALGNHEYVLDENGRVANFFPEQLYDGPLNHDPIKKILHRLEILEC